MPVEFSEMEQGIIRNSMLRKSHKQIASLLDCEEAAVSAFVQSINDTSNLLTQQMKLDAKKARAPKRVKPAKAAGPVKEKKAKDSPEKKKLDKTNAQLRKDQEKALRESLKRDKQQAHVEQMNMKAQAKNARRPKRYADIPVDYNELVTIRIDRKTIIYSKPGMEVETRKRFLKNYKKLLTIKTPEND